MAHVSSNWFRATLSTWLPSYLKNHLGFNYSSSGILAALPSIGSFITCLIGSRICDLLIRKYKGKRLVIRKVF